MKRFVKMLATSGAMLSLGTMATPAHAWYAIVYYDQYGQYVSHEEHCEDGYWLGSYEAYPGASLNGVSSQRFDLGVTGPYYC